MEKLENCIIDEEFISNNYNKSEEENKVVKVENTNSEKDDRKFNLDELEEMISKGINPPGIEIIDDMPKENKESVIDHSSSKLIKKPWETVKNKDQNEDVNSSQ